jgi:hypothetical protein
MLLSFPNIRTLYYLGLSPKPQNYQGGSDYPWKKKIKDVVDLSMNGSIYHMLSSGECPNLTRLETDIESKHVGIFKNAPALTTLVLNNFVGNFSSLEELHDCSPQLKSLSITFGRFSISGFHRNIKPAASVTACLFTFSKIRPDTNESTISVLKYVGIKYPNLSTLEFEYDEIVANDEVNELGWLPLFNTLGNKLKKLRFNTPKVFDGFVEVLDQCRCQINYLEISHVSDTAFKKLVQSQQMRHIQTFNFELTRDNILNGFNWLQELEVLTSLTLKSPHDGCWLSLNMILDNCPSTLKALSLSHSDLVANLLPTGIYTIETLSLIAVRLPKDIDTFISHCFPKLSKLELKYCEMPVGTWTLDSMDLIKFTFANYFNNDRQTILVKYNNETNWFTYREVGFRSLHMMQNNGIFQDEFDMSFKCATENTSKVSPDFTLACKSLRNFEFKV